jgi:cysteine desulfurase
MVQVSRASTFPRFRGQGDSEGTALEKYFDANATTGQLESVIEAVNRAAAAGPLNASSAHSRGDQARRVLSSARETVAGALGIDDEDNVIFVSGGTEANNIVVNGIAGVPKSRLIVSAVEHASVLEPADAAGAVRIAVNADGILDLGALEAALDETPPESTVLVCVQAANSETGVVQPTEDIAGICRAAGDNVFLHVDAAQAFGRIDIPMEGVSSLAFSGHKLHAPLGTGFLYLSDALAEVLPRTVLGGGQERGFRSGTQNVPGIAGLEAAVRERFETIDGCVQRLVTLRTLFEALLVGALPDARIIGANSPRLPNTSNVLFPGIENFRLMARLDEAGVVCSNGSACSAMKPSPSPVLTAMGLSEGEAFSCLRFSFSILNLQQEIIEAVASIAEQVNHMKAHA